MNGALPWHFVGVLCVLAMMPAIIGCPISSPPGAPPLVTEEVDGHPGDGEPLPPTEEELAEQARKYQEAVERQARVFRDATVTIHRVYNYAGPLVTRRSSPTKLIGVDIEMEGFTESFYLHSLQVVDGVTGKSYGGPTDGAFMTPEGTIKEKEFSLLRYSWPDPPGPVRALLVYALPTDSSNSIQLKYNDHLVTPEPVVVEGTGPALPPNRR